MTAVADGWFLTSERLGFRHWRASDQPLALALWGEPAVTRFIAAGGFTAAEIRARLDDAEYRWVADVRDAP